jgi:hypothetical protein
MAECMVRQLRPKPGLEATRQRKQAGAVALARGGSAYNATPMGELHPREVVRASLTAAARCGGAGGGGRGE